MNFNKVFRLGLKYSLAFAFLSAVADRFGIWGAAGSEGVVWGDFENFTAYTVILAPWAEGVVALILAWFVTVLEVVLGILLFTNFKTKNVAFASGILLSIFGISMILTVGIKAALDYSVFTAAFGALYLSRAAT